MKIRIDHTQVIDACSTDKAYAIKFNRNSHNMVFLSKRFTSLETETRRSKDDTMIYLMEFPDWLYGKMNDEQRLVIDLILDQWKDGAIKSDGLEMVQRIIKKKREEEEWEAECEHRQNEDLGINDDYKERAL